MIARPTLRRPSHEIPVDISHKKKRDERTQIGSARDALHISHIKK